ncbi:unnamed protein product, partial [Closterium sp. Naga37s-1]
ATVCTAYGASATSLSAPLLSHLGDSSIASADSTASAAQAKPLFYKGKVVVKYVAKLRPTKTGDKGARGKVIYGIK